MLKELEVFLESNDYKIVEVLQNSDWKSTYILKIEKDKEVYVLKGFNPETPVEIKKKFNNEINFYKKNKFEFLPKLIASNEFCLVCHTCCVI
jgi:hydroxymethylpyrimidine pyrophosphatase-like HAD family hydrolase